MLFGGMNSVFRTYKSHYGTTAAVVLRVGDDDDDDKILCFGCKHSYVENATSQRNEAYADKI